MSEQKKNPQEMYEQKIGKIEGILKHEKEFRRTYGEKGGNVIRDAQKILKNQMGAALQLKTVAESSTLADDKQKSRVKEMLNLLLDIALYKPMTDMIRELSIETSQLAYNWNQQVGLCSDIERITRTLERIVAAQRTLDDTIQISKKLLDRLQREMSRRPVAYELARHYLKSIPLSSKKPQENKKYKKVEAISKK